MKPVRYVTLDPTGNTTCLVLDPVEEKDRGRVTDLLMRRCEQVGYLQPPLKTDAKARLQMMGGEFCGNAAMATAAYLVKREGAAGKTVVTLEGSGANGVISCAAWRMSDRFWEGTVEMPPILDLMPIRLGDMDAVLVRMEGITHLILQDVRLDRTTAEALLKEKARELPDTSVGLLLWNSRANYMKPLVFVKKSDTLVWETGCGSGSTAIGAWLASREGSGIVRTDIQQPGGIIRAEAAAENGTVQYVRISGKIRIGKEEILHDETL